MTEPIRVRKIVKQLQPRLNQIVRNLIKDATLDAKTKSALREVWVYPVDQMKGCAYYEHSTITIPGWAFQTRRRGFLRHYVAHELAHIAAQVKYQKGAGHGPEFYKCLKQLTKDTLHYELEYKPRNAAAAGIKKPKQNGKI